MEIIKKTNIDFIGKRKVSFGVSAVLVLLGFVCIAMIMAGRANMGIDFAGGASASYLLGQEVKLDEAREALQKAGFKDVELQSLTSEIEQRPLLLVKIKKTDVPIDQVVDSATAALVAAFPDTTVEIDSSSAIGPTIGKALQKQALWAITLALLGIIIYIAWRFEFKFGVAATIATFHDVLAVMGVFYILNKEITLLVVVALLTLAGYSLTDTVVVFDRIRENLRFRQKDGLLDIINSSINEVLSRTVITSLTTFLVVLSLFLIGGEVLHDFALALMMGVIVGTYSSVFVASPLLYVWRGSKGGRLIKAAMLTKEPVKAVGSLKAADAKPAPASAPKPAPKPVPEPAPEPSGPPAEEGSADAGGKGKKGKGRGRKKAKGRSK